MAQNAVDAALANIDAQIADLERARGLIVTAAASAPADAEPRKPRKPRKKRGMPAGEPEL